MDDDEEEDDSTIKMGTLDSLFYGTTNPQEEDKEVEIRMRVSSCHLSLASPVLSTQLEVSRLQPTTRAARPANAIHLTGWDAKALVTLLNIIYGQNSQVPRNVDFGFMTHIVVVVHHLKCVEAVQLYSELWLSTFEKTCNAISQQRVPNVAVWLLGISLEKEFSHCAQLLLSDYEGPGTDTLHDVPLTEVLDKFDGMRITLIKKVFTALENLEQTLSTEHGCPEAGLEQCTAMALGVLIRGERMFQNIEE